MEDKLKIESNLVKSIENEEPLSSANFKDAEKINFKALPEKIYETDEFGFMKKNLKELSKSEMKKQNARIEKWNKMLEDPKKFNISNKKLKERARKGIPDPLRRLVWAKFASVEEYVEENEGVYEKFKTTENPDKEIENVILRDINRTFPNHSHFNEKYGEGQRSLFNVLNAYSIFNQKVGYVQGMGFFAALMLTYMEEEYVFWMIHSFLRKFGQQPFFENGFPGLKKSFFVLAVLMKKEMPKCFDKLNKLEIIPSIYASPWFMTMFTNTLSFDSLVRVLDVFFLEGQKIKYRIALAILKLNKDKIEAAKNFETLCTLMSRKLLEGVETEDLIKEAFKVNISRAQIEKYERYFVENEEKLPKFEEDLMLEIPKLNL